MKSRRLPAHVRQHAVALSMLGLLLVALSGCGGAKEDDSPPADQAAPTVRVSTPSIGSTVKGTVSIAADASDDVGVVGVQFQLDGADLGAEDTSAPFAISWDSTKAADRAYVLTAKARDAAGHITTSSAVNVTVSNAAAPDKVAPTVSLPTPSAGATVSGTVSLSANASDDVGVVAVQFKLDGNNLGAEDTGAPFTLAWDSTKAANGSHSLTATARDAAGNAATSSAVNVTISNTVVVVDKTPPTLSIALASPAAPANASGSVTITATANDDVGVAGVQFKLDGVNLGSEDTAPPYAAAWDTTKVSNGSHQLTAIARDAAGNSATSETLTVTVSNTAADKTPPTVSITAPSAMSTVSGTVSITATAADNVGVAGVQFQLDGVALGAEEKAAPYSLSWDSTKVVNGSHLLTAIARDAANNKTTSATVSLTVANVVAPPDTTAPIVSLTSPTGGATVSGVVSMSANATDNVGVVGVQFKLDGAKIGSEDTSAPYTASWDSTLAGNGTHKLSATARDAAGNTTDSATVSVNVSNTSSGSTLAATPLISRGVPAYSSSGKATDANDTAYDSEFRTTVPGWLAYDLSSVPVAQRGNVIVAWYNNGTYNYDHGLLPGQVGYNIPGSYTIEANAAAGGSNAAPSGGWVTLATVAANTRHSRQHAVNLTGYNWVRIKVTASDGSPQNMDAGFNFDVHDAHLGANDDWIFFGDSITANAMAKSESSANGTANFASLIHAARPEYFPVAEGGGTGGWKTTEGAKYMATWLADFPGHFVGLSYGTNDANGSGCDSKENLAHFYGQYEVMVKAVLAANKVPVIPSLVASPADFIQQCGPLYNAQIDLLILAYPKIVRGPDLWTYFKNNSDLFQDALHPSPKGNAGLRQQWANTMLQRVYP